MPIPTKSELDGLLQEAQRLIPIAKKAAKLADSQQKAIEALDLETLEAILRQKQPFIDQLLAFRQFKATYELYISSSAFQIPDLLVSLYAELEDKIQSLAEADEKAIELLAKRHAEKAQELQILMRDRRAASCYGQPAQHQAKPRIDMTG